MKEDKNGVEGGAIRNGRTERWQAVCKSLHPAQSGIEHRRGTSNGNGQPIATSKDFLDVEDSPEGPALAQPTPDNPDPHGIFIKEVQGRNKRLRQLI